MYGSYIHTTLFIFRHTHVAPKSDIDIITLFNLDHRGRTWLYHPGTEGLQAETLEVCDRLDIAAGSWDSYRMQGTPKSSRSYLSIEIYGNPWVWGSTILGNLHVCSLVYRQKAWLQGSSVDQRSQRTGARPCRNQIGSSPRIFSFRNLGTLRNSTRMGD